MASRYPPSSTAGPLLPSARVYIDVCAHSREGARTSTICTQGMGGRGHSHATLVAPVLKHLVRRVGPGTAGVQTRNQRPRARAWCVLWAEDRAEVRGTTRAARAEGRRAAMRTRSRLVRHSSPVITAGSTRAIARLRSASAPCSAGTSHRRCTARATLACSDGKGYPQGSHQQHGPAPNAATLRLPPLAQTQHTDGPFFEINMPTQAKCPRLARLARTGRGVLRFSLRPPGLCGRGERQHARAARRGGV